MKYFILFFFISVVTAGKAQEVVNLILVGDKGVTENIMEANAFIAVKKYPTYFQRLDYNLHAPLKKVRNYTDSTLTVLEGNFYEYDVNGALKISGNYVNNLKDKDWYFYNDTGKVVLEEKYAQGILMTTVNPDTVTKEKSLEKNFVKVDQEATFKKGNKDWIKYLSENVNGELADKSVKGGMVRAGFMVNKVGKCVDIYIKKSVEFVLDEEIIRVIENSPLWHAAIREGKNVNAFRVQPLTFSKQ